MSPSVRSEMVLLMAERCSQALSESPEEFLGRASLSRAQVANVGRVPLSCVHELWDVATRRSACLPARLGTSLPLEELGPFGFAVLTAPTAREGVESAARLFPWLNNAAQWRVETTRTLRIRMEADRADSLGAAAMQEELVAHFASGMRRLVERPPLEVRFRHRRPSYASMMTSYLDCPVIFDADATEVSFERDPFDAPAPWSNSLTHGVLVDYLLGELRSHGTPNQSVAQTTLLRVRAVLARGAAWDARSLSDACGISERSLRRYLRQEGTSLRELRDRVRAERALELIATSRSILDIALELGFGDATAFTRAFRRWHGRPPREARTQTRMT